MDVVTRKEARERGLGRYFTGKPCVRNHVAERAVTSKVCVQCNRDKVAAWQRANPQNVKESRKRNSKTRAEAAKRAKLQNPEKHKATSRAWREQNKAKVNAGIAAAKKKNPQKYRALYVAWTEQNRERVRASHRVWASKNKETVAANQRVQGAKRRGARGRYTKLDVETILKAQRGRCAYSSICGTRLGRGSAFHVDHILAISRGGTNDPSNLQILCPNCNMRKGARDAISFVQRHGMLL